MPTAERAVRISFACNDDRNGLFAGRAYCASVAVRRGEFDLYHDDIERGSAFAVEAARLRIHRRWFPFVSRKEWFGNWCWDAFYLARPVAIGLIDAMRRSGVWHCEGGTARLCDWWDGLPKRATAIAPQGDVRA